MDWVGYLLFTAALSGLTIGLTWGKNPCQLPWAVHCRVLLTMLPRPLELGSCPCPLTYRSWPYICPRRASMEVPQGWAVLATYVLQVEESGHRAHHCCH